MNNLINKCVKMISGSKGGNMPVYKYQTKEGTKWYVKSDSLTKRGYLWISKQDERCIA